MSKYDHEKEAKLNPTAYAGSVLIGGTSLSIAEAANLQNDMPPIIARFGVWVVSNDGSIGCLEFYYFIDKPRINQPHWSKHVGAKTGVNKNDFDQALAYAKALP